MAIYIPITDQEIEPEAPLTSILHHKLRDNPEAVFAGADNAPRLQSDAYGTNSIPARAWNFAEATESSITNKVFTLMGGLYNWNMRWKNDGSTAETSHAGFKVTQSRLSTLAPYVEFNYGGVGGGTVTSGYFVDPQAINDLDIFFFKIDGNTGDILSKIHCPNHPSYGFDKFIDHPFLELNDVDFVNFVTLTKQQVEKLTISTYPILGGGYLTSDIINNNTPYEIDLYRERRSILESFTDLVTVNSNDIIDYPDFEYSVLRPFSLISDNFIKSKMIVKENLNHVSFDFTQ